MSIAILLCGLMLGGCLENLSDKEYPTINLKPVSNSLTDILVQAQSERLLVSDIIINRGNNCKVFSTAPKPEVNQEKVNALIANGMTEEELGKNYNIYKEKGIFVAGSNIFGMPSWKEESRKLNLYHPFELKFGEELRMLAECRADAILEIVLNTDKGDLSYDFKN